MGSYEEFIVIMREIFQELKTVTRTYPELIHLITQLYHDADNSMWGQEMVHMRNFPTIGFVTPSDLLRVHYSSFTIHLLRCSSRYRALVGLPDALPDMKQKQLVVAAAKVLCEREFANTSRLANMNLDFLINATLLIGHYLVGKFRSTNNYNTRIERTANSLSMVQSLLRYLRTLLFADSSRGHACMAAVLRLTNTIIEEFIPGYTDWFAELINERIARTFPRKSRKWLLVTAKLCNIMTDEIRRESKLLTSLENYLDCESHKSGHLRTGMKPLPCPCRLYALKLQKDKFQRGMKSTNQPITFTSKTLTKETSTNPTKANYIYNSFQFLSSQNKTEISSKGIMILPGFVVTKSSSNKQAMILSGLRETESCSSKQAVTLSGLQEPEWSLSSPMLEQTGSTSNKQAMILPGLEESKSSSNKHAMILPGLGETESCSSKEAVTLPGLQEPEWSLSSPMLEQTGSTSNKQAMILPGLEESKSSSNKHAMILPGLGETESCSSKEAVTLPGLQEPESSSNKQTGILPNLELIDILITDQRNENSNKSNETSFNPWNNISIKNNSWHKAPLYRRCKIWLLKNWPTLAEASGSEPVRSRKFRSKVVFSGEVVKA